MNLDKICNELAEIQKTPEITQEKKDLFFSCAQRAMNYVKFGPEEISTLQSLKEGITPLNKKTAYNIHRLFLSQASDDCILSHLGLGEWGKTVGEKEALARIITCFRNQSTTLDLSKLELTALPPGVATTSKRLTKLDCSNNKLISLPSEIGEIYTIEAKGNPLSNIFSLLPSHYSYRIQQVHLSAASKIQKTWVCEQTLLSLYGLLYQENPAECLQNQPIVISGFVDKDGLGDYYQILATANTLYEQFGIPVRIFIKVENLKERLPNLLLPNPEKFQLTIVDAKENNAELEKKIMEGSSIIIDTPHIKKALLSSNIKFYEYDWCSEITNLHFSDNGEHHVMGLGPYSLGITLKDPTTVGDLPSLQDTELKQLLLSNQGSPEDIQTYNATHRMIYGYLDVKTYKHSEGSEQDLYVQFFTNSICRDLSEDSHSIDLICPFARILNKNWPPPRERNHIDFDIDELKMRGVQTIQLFKKDPNQKLVLMEEINTGLEKGKALRLINPFPIANTDTQILTKASYRYVGCKGDLSPTECLSYEKLPWYQIAPHKVRFFNSLKETTTSPTLEMYFQSIDTLNSYIKAPHLWNKDSIEEEALLPLESCMKSPNFKAEIESFSNMIKKNYNFNKVLIDFVYRFRAEKEFTLSRHSLIYDYVHQKKSLEECYHIFKCRIEYAKLAKIKDLI